MSEGKQFNYQCRCCFLEVIPCEISTIVEILGGLFVSIMVFFCVFV